MKIIYDALVVPAKVAGAAVALAYSAFKKKHKIVARMHAKVVDETVSGAYNIEADGEPRFTLVCEGGGKASMVLQEGSGINGLLGNVTDGLTLVRPYDAVVVDATLPAGAQVRGLRMTTDGANNLNIELAAPMLYVKRPEVIPDPYNFDRLAVIATGDVGLVSATSVADTTYDVVVLNIQYNGSSTWAETVDINEYGLDGAISSTHKVAVLALKAAAAPGGIPNAVAKKDTITLTPPAGVLAPLVEGEESPKLHFISSPLYELYRFQPDSDAATAAGFPPTDPPVGHTVVRVTTEFHEVSPKFRRLVLTSEYVSYGRYRHKLTIENVYESATAITKQYLRTAIDVVPELYRTSYTTTQGPAVAPVYTPDVEATDVVVDPAFTYSPPVKAPDGLVVVPAGDIRTDLNVQARFYNTKTSGGAEEQVYFVDSDVNEFGVPEVPPGEIYKLDKASGVKTALREGWKLSAKVVATGGGGSSMTIDNAVQVPISEVELNGATIGAYSYRTPDKTGAFFTNPYNRGLTYAFPEIDEPSAYAAADLALGYGAGHEKLLSFTAPRSRKRTSVVTEESDTHYVLDYSSSTGYAGVSPRGVQFTGTTTFHPVSFAAGSTTDLVPEHTTRDTAPCRKMLHIILKNKSLLYRYWTTAGVITNFTGVVSDEVEAFIDQSQGLTVFDGTIDVENPPGSPVPIATRYCDPS
jgi:hypothetical protein